MIAKNGVTININNNIAGGGGCDCKDVDIQSGNHSLNIERRETAGKVEFDIRANANGNGGDGNGNAKAEIMAQYIEIAFEEGTHILEFYFIGERYELANGYAYVTKRRVLEGDADPDDIHYSTEVYLRMRDAGEGIDPNMSIKNFDGKLYFKRPDMYYGGLKFFVREVTSGGVLMREAGEIECPTGDMSTDYIDFL